MRRKLNKTRIMESIKCSENFCEKAKSKEKYTDYGLTIYGCEMRNLGELKEMLEKDYYIELTEREKDLYRAIL